MIPTLLLAVTVTLQLTVVGLSLYFLGGTFWRRVWRVIIVLSVTVGFRRSLMVGFAIYNQSASYAAIMEDAVALVILSIILTCGAAVLFIMFRSMERSEAILRENEARFRGIVENTSAGYFFCDREGVYQNVNRAWLEMHGYDSPDEIIGKHYSCTHVDAAPELEQQYRETILAGKSIPSGESSCIRLDGALCHHTFSVHPVIQNGEVIGAEGFLINTTESKIAEQALRESEEKYHILFMGSRDALMTLDVATGHFIAGNPSTLEMFGIKDASEFCRYTPWELSPEYQPDGRESAEKAQEIITRILSEGSQYFEWVHKRLNGETFYTTVLCTRLTLNGETIVQSTVRDITERKRAEQALRDSEERYNQLAMLNRTITWEMDATALCTYVSDVVESVLGYKPEEFIGKRHCYELGPESEWEKRKKHAFDVYARKEPYVNYENKATTKDGRIVWLSSNGIPILDKDGTLLGYRGMDTDITERKQMQEEKERLQEQFVHTQKIECVGRLAGGIAHDYNNKLAIILGYLEFAKNHVGSNEPLRKSLEKIETAARSSVELTSQILTFARKQAVAPQHIDLNETVDGLLGMMRKVIGEDIQLIWNPASIAAWIKIDPVQVDQILANLLLNARDAIAGSGSITVETADAVIDDAYCASHSDAVAGDYVLLAVSDDGCGMDKDTLANVFEPFFTTKDVGEGTGLGLSTVYGIVKQNDGFINAYSEPGHGTTFKIYLPRSAAHPMPDFLPVAEAISDSSNETILVVEDESDLLDLCKIMLESIGYQVFAANNPEEAVRQIEEHKGKIQLVITDVVLPTMNGRDLVNTLLTHAPDLKVLYMSGYTADTITQRGILDPGVHFLQKPFSSNLLVAKVQEALHDA
jgi:two-component system, cell cycle sensor histidine kinase and response regulator CckA